MASTTRTDPTQAIQDTAEMASSSLEHARTFGDTAVDQAQQVLSSASDTAQQMSRQAQEFAGEAYRRGGEVARQLGQSVEEQPFVAIAIAFGVGYLVSYLLHAR